MAGRKTLRSIRLAREATNGTRVTPRYLWRGNGDWIVDEREVTKVEELVGISGGTDRTYIAKLAASVEIAETEATYKQLPALFYAMGLTPRTGYNTFGTRVPAMNQGASGSVWRYGLNIPSTVFPTNYSYTVESGDNVESQVAVYAVTEEVQLTFEAGEAAKVSANMLAQYGTRTNDEGSFSAVGTLENVTVMLSSKTKAFDITPVSNTGVLTSIEGVTASQYFFIQDSQNVIMRDGVEWTTVYTSSTILRNIFALNATNVWVVGNDGLIVYYNGSTWTAQTSGTTSTLLSIWGSSATSVWVVGTGGAILFWNGTTWTAQTSGTTNILYSVWGSSSTSVWVVGASGTILFWNGTTWTAQTSGTTSTLFSVWGSSATSVWVVGAGGTILFSSNGGSTWTAQTSGTTSTLFSVWGSSATSVWVVGTGGTILFSSNGGSTWTAQTSGITTILYSVWGSSATSVWIVGVGGTILFSSNGGSTWTTLSWWPIFNNVASGNLLKAELTFKALWAPKYWIDGGILYPGTMVLTGHEITGKLTFEHQKSGTISAAGTSGQIEKWRNQQAQVLNLLWQDSDSVGSEVGFGLVLPFKWDTLQEYDDMDGNNIVSGEFTSKYNETFAGRGYMFFETGFDYSNIVGTV